MPCPPSQLFTSGSGIDDHHNPRVIRGASANRIAWDRIFIITLPVTDEVACCVPTSRAEIALLNPSMLPESCFQKKTITAGSISEPCTAAKFFHEVGTTEHLPRWSPWGSCTSFYAFKCYGQDPRAAALSQLLTKRVVYRVNVIGSGMCLEVVCQMPFLHRMDFEDYPVVKRIIHIDDIYDRSGH